MNKGEKSTPVRLDNIGIVVEDLDAAIAFFVELGLEFEGRTIVEGKSVDDLIALKDVRSDIVMLRTADGHGRIELSRFQKPRANHAKPNLPVNTFGIGRLMFAVTDMDDVIARLKRHGAKLVGEMVNYESIYRLCYLRGPEGILIALAEDLRHP